MMPARVDSGFFGTARSANPIGQSNEPHEHPGLLSPGAVYLAGPPVATKRGFSPNYRPFPLEEIGAAIRQQMFKIAAGCCLKATGKKPRGLDDAAAVKAAGVTPETTEQALREIRKKEAEKVRLSYEDQIRKAKSPAEKTRLARSRDTVVNMILNQLKQGQSVVDSKPPRILILPRRFADAVAGKNLPKKGSARMLYRLIFLEEQAHIYLHLRGVSFDAQIKTGGLDDLDKILDGVGTDSCHHEAIPLAKKSYLARHKQALGDLDLRFVKFD